MSIDIGNELNRARSALGDDYVQRILTILQKRTQPKTEDEAYTVHTPHEDLINVHNLTESLTEIDVGDAEISKQEADDGIDFIPYTKFIPDDPANMEVYSITHTDSGTWSFPDTGLKYGARTTLAGTQHIQLTPYESSTQMDMGTGAFSVGLWVKNLGAGTYGILNKRDIASTTNAGLEIYFSGGTDVNCRISDGTNTSILSQTITGIDLTEDSWHSIILNIPASGNMEVFGDNVSKGTQARGSVSDIDNSRDAYIFARDNAGTIGDKLVGDIAWFVWKAETWSSAQRTDFHTNGILDLETTGAEVTTMPFLGDTNPYQNASLGMFYA